YAHQDLVLPRPDRELPEPELGLVAARGDRYGGPVVEAAHRPHQGSVACVDSDPEVPLPNPPPRDEAKLQHTPFPDRDHVVVFGRPVHTPSGEPDAIRWDVLSRPQVAHWDCLELPVVCFRHRLGIAGEYQLAVTEQAGSPTQGRDRPHLVADEQGRPPESGQFRDL